jgi:hypothetical protein
MSNNKTDLSAGFALPRKKLAAAPIEETFITAGERKTATSKRSNGPGQRCVVYLPEKLLKALKHKCTDDNRSVSDAVCEAVRKLLGEGGALR